MLDMLAEPAEPRGAPPIRLNPIIPIAPTAGLPPRQLADAVPRDVPMPSPVPMRPNPIGADALRDIGDEIPRGAAR